MAKTMPSYSLTRDDFFEIPGDPFIYAVDFNYLFEDGSHSIVATNCQTGEVTVFDRSVEAVDFLYR